MFLLINHFFLLLKTSPLALCSHLLFPVFILMSRLKLPLPLNHEFANESFECVVLKREGSVFSMGALGALQTFCFSLIPVQTRSSLWYDKHLHSALSSWS